MKKGLGIRKYIVPSAVIAYITLTLIAYFYFPGQFTPNTNWLSDLGDVGYNPQGWILYNIGVILTGFLIGLYFLGISNWILENRTIQQWMVRLTQFFGVLGCFSLIMSGLFPINNIEQHRIWSIALYCLLGTSFAFSIAALRYHPWFPRWVLFLGVITTIVDIFSSFLHEVTLLEWATVILFLTYIFTINLIFLIHKR